MSEAKLKIGCVSVVIPVYNGERYLRRAIDSVLAQTYFDVEIVVIDDGSTDSSPAMLREYGDKLSIYQQPNCGRVGLVRNTGIDRSQGEFVAFLDQDDWWLPEKLALQVAAMRSSEKIGLVHTAVEDFDENGCSEGVYLNANAHPERITGQCFQELLLGNPIYNSSVLVRRSVLQQVGVCDLQIPGNTVQDYDLWLRIARAFAFAFISETLTRYQMHSGQGMWRRKEMLTAEYNVLLKIQSIAVWRSSAAGRHRLAKLCDEIATAYFEADDISSARTYFSKAVAFDHSPRQWLRWSACLLPFPMIRAIRSGVQNSAGRSEDFRNGSTGVLKREKIRMAVMWPIPRRERWRSGLDFPTENPDQSDALLFLEELNFEVNIEDSTAFPFNPLKFMHAMYSGIDPTRTIRILWRLRQYDVVVGVGASVALLLVYAKRWFRLRIPLVLIDPALTPDYTRREKMQKLILPNVDKVIVFGRVQLDYLRKQYGNRVNSAFVRHRIDTVFYCPGKTSETSNTLRIVSVGEDASRDFPTLIRAVEICRTLGRNDFQCVIKTPLPLSDLPSNVEVLKGRLSWVGLRDLYRGATIVVLPLRNSIHAGGINTLLESMAIACPVIVSSSQGIFDYVEHERTAILVEPENPESLARAIIRLLDDRELRNKIGTEARKTVVSHCDNTVYADSIAKILNEVVHNAKN